MRIDSDPLVGRPLSAQEHELAEKLSEWAESDEFEIPDSAVILVGPEAATSGRALMERIVGKEALDRAIARGGRE